MKLIYVEDNAADADLTRRALPPAFELEVAATLQEGIDRLAGTPAYDLVLADLRLPDGSGLGLLAHVRERALPLAVVVLTGSGDQESAVAALKAGADDYVVKRGDYLKHLPQALNAALARFRRAAALRARPLRVLYAEHNVFDVDLTRRHLAQHAPHIVLEVVASAAEALARLPGGTADPPLCDVLLMDFRLPGLDALEAVKILQQERGLDLPVVMVTGQGSEEVAAQALRLGVADYLFKHPGYLFELPAVLEKVHQRAQLAREQAALSRAQRRYQELAARIPVGVYRMRLSGPDGIAFDFVSPRLCEMLGVAEEAFLTDSSVAFAVVHPDDRPELIRRTEEARVTHQPFAWEGRFEVPGGMRWIRLEATPTVLDGGQTSLWDGVVVDLTERRHAEAKLRLDAAVIESTRDGIMVTDLAPSILSVNRAFTDITGYSEAEALGKNPSILQSGRQDRAFYQALWSSLLETGGWQGEVWNRRKNGEVYPEWLSVSTVRNEGGEPTHYVGVHTDLSQLKQRDERLERLAHYDPLTDMPNRLLLLSRLEHALEHAERQRVKVAVLFIDLDRFKTINDGLGHAAGDQLLVAVAQRLRSHLRAEDTLSRLGGDEFVALLEQVREAQDAALVARELLAALRRAFVLPGTQEIYVHASLGISIYPTDGADAAELLRDAEAAMYQAKDQGRNLYRFYTEALTRAANERLDLEIGVRRALDQGELVLHYQPLVSIPDGRVLGAEALVRWQPPGEAPVSPVRFIPVAEETGLIIPLGAWVLRSACAQAKAWLDAGAPLETVAVNLSLPELRHPGIEERLSAVLAETGLPARYLELEITETGLMQQGERAEAALQALKELGVRLAVDDFGTGYSSLAYLKRLPLDKLKIDRSFMHDIPADPNDVAIAETIVAMAHKLGLEVLAEGVETEAQLAFLREQGCDTYQGYLFSPALPAAEFARRFLRLD